jgi:hypothetical protein
MNELLVSFLNKLPDAFYILKINSIKHKAAYDFLKNIIDEQGFEINQENLSLWALLLQQIPLTIFTTQELLAVMEIELTHLFNNQKSRETYVITDQTNLLVDQDGLLSQSLDLTKIDLLYQQQFKVNYHYSKNFFYELFLGHLKTAV